MTTTYPAVVTAVPSAYTVTAQIDLGFHLTLRTDIVVAGLDPTTVGLSALLPAGTEVTLTPVDSDTFAVTLPDGRDVKTTLTVGWPHALPLDAMRASPRLVFAHYVPSLPVSLDNKDPASDYYQTQYLTPDGEKGIHKAYGGFTRDRPEGRPVRPEANWRSLDFQAEVQTAIGYGINGFAVNIFAFPAEAAKTNQPGLNVGLLMDAAAAVSPDFRMMLMPDMTAGIKAKTPDQLAASVATLGKHPACYRLDDGRLVVAPFHPETHPAAWWQQFLASKAWAGETVAFLPCPLSASPLIDGYAPFAYGIGEWGTTDPADNDPVATAARIAAAHRAGLKWMQPVSVQDNRPRDGRFWEAQNTTNLRQTWQLAIDNGAEFVMLRTWNDYAEGTQFAPSVQHGRAFLDISSYYAAWWKLGAPPTILQDAVIVTHRTQPWQAKPTYPETLLMRNAGTTKPQDTVEALCFLTGPGTVTFGVGEAVTSIDAPAGMSASTAPLGAGAVRAAVSRGGVPTASAASPYPVTATPAVQDLGYVAASSLG